MILMVLITVSLSAMGQEELMGINGTYAEMVRKYSHVLEIIEKGDDFTGFMYDRSCLIYVFKDMENEGVHKIISLEYTRTKAEGYAKIKQYMNSMRRQGMIPVRDEENGDIVYTYQNKYCGGNYCHSEVIANPKRIYNRKGYNYRVYSVCIPTI